MTSQADGSDGDASPNRQLRSDGAGDPDAPTAIGLVFGDGVVLAATAGRANGSTVTGSAASVAAVHPTAAVTLTAGLGDAQTFARELRVAVEGYEQDRGERLSIDALATRAADLLREEFRPVGRLLLGGTDGEGPHLSVLDGEGGAVEDEFAAVGSGGPVATGALEAGYEPGLDRDAAVSLATEALETARDRDTATTGAAHVAVITDAVDVRELGRDGG